MTRKDYILIARALANARPIVRAPEWKTWENVRENIAEVLKSDNSAFDRERFYTATEEGRSFETLSSEAR